ncbi:CopG family antitoxin [Paracoccus endophyticus]|uniref:CopG family antitoxin n=1 Tax=Paracoccus endophyticus TaxID=2233774 RepID=UPI000DDA605B|nr:CopG family antitoxin [Paracoccus endophyticus]
MKHKWPVLTSDEDAERFVEEADLTEYDFSQMVPVSYEFEAKAAALVRLHRPSLKP